jgi:hypothetical protein
MRVDGGGGSGGGRTVDLSIMLSQTIGSGVDGTGGRGFFLIVLPLQVCGDIRV